MNLLIAMMSQTYTEVQTTAHEMYLMEYARSLKEYHEAPTLPLPLQWVEHAVNAIAERGHCTEMFRKRHAGLYAASHGENAKLRWGKHFTWPRSTLVSRMTIARRKLTTARQVSRKFVWFGNLVGAHSEWQCCMQQCFVVVDICASCRWRKNK